MRGSAILLALLLLLASVAMAEPGPGGDPSPTGSGDPGPGSNSTSNSTSSSPAPRPAPSCPPGGPQNASQYEACKEQYCREHTSDERCAKPTPPPTPAQRRDPWRRWCQADDGPDEASCAGDVESFSPRRGGEWVTFRMDAANATLLDYTVGGALLAKSVHLETGSANLSAERTGSTLRIGDDDTELTVHDDPTGLLRFKGEDGSASLVLPASARVERATDGSVARITLEGGRIAYFRSDNATWVDGHTVLVAGFFALMLPPPPQKEGHDGQVQGELKQAVENRRLGAEITLRAAPPAGAAAASNGSVQVLAYDDVSVKVQMPSGRIATPDAPIRVQLSAGLHEGRTIVLNLNRSLLQSGDPDTLVLRYYDLDDQADGSTVESEVAFHRASSLQDVLDPSDDGGQPEYWVVQDANGLQALVSVPHWSSHAITVASVAEALAQPNVMYGVIAGSVGTMLAAVAMLWPRRPRDDE